MYMDIPPKLTAITPPSKSSGGAEPSINNSINILRVVLIGEKCAGFLE
jgi:hypothetical protein